MWAFNGRCAVAARLLLNAFARTPTGTSLTEMKISPTVMYTFAATSAILAVYFAGYATVMRDANVELKVDAVVLAMEVSLLQRSVDSGKSEIAKLNAEIMTAGKMCGFKNPVRRGKHGK